MTDEGQKSTVESRATDSLDWEVEQQVAALDRRMIDDCMSTPPTLESCPKEGVSAEIPGYTILAILGKGGMGVVYQAKHIRLDCLCALKMLLPGHHDTEELVGRFHTEAQAIARLTHPNIVRIYEIGQADDKPFLSLEFCPGGNLADKLKGTPQEPHQAARLVRSLAEAMQTAHEANVIHRDLKPANVLLTEDGIPKITDFGLAKKLDDVGQTASGAIMGTPSYMSPEQAQGRTQEIGPATDIYALGAILYETLTGRPPFIAATTFETLRQVLNDPPVPPRRLQPGVPRDLETITLKCLKKEPGRRYASAAELAEDLRRFLNNEPIKARPAGVLEKGLKWVKRNPAQAWIAALFTLLLLGAAGWWALDYLRTVKHASELTQEIDRTRAADQTTQRHLYAARMRPSARILEAGQMTQLSSLLDATRPENGKVDFRGWECDYLSNLCQSESLRFGNHKGALCAAVFSPDGRLVASSDDLGTVLIWDASTGEQRIILEGFHQAVLNLAFSPDGKYLAVACEDSTAGIFELATRRLLHRLKAHVLAVNWLAFSHDGQLLATASQDNTLKIWNSHSGQEVCTLCGHTGDVRRVWFHANGQRCASVGGDRTIRWWSLPSGEEVKPKVVALPSATIALAPDLDRLALWEKEPQYVFVGARASGKGFAAIPGFPRPPTDVAFNANGTLLATTNEKGVAVVWDVQADRMLAKYHGQAKTVNFSPAGSRIVSTCLDGFVRVWPSGIAGRNHFVGHDGRIERVLFDPSGNMIATGDIIGSIRLWDSRKGTTVRILGKHLVEKGPEGTPRSKALQEAIANKQIRTMQHFITPTGVYGPDSLREAWTVEGHGRPIVALAFSRDGKLLASAGDTTARLWEVATGKQLHVLRHPMLTSCLAFSPDGHLLVSGGWDGTARIWNVADGSETMKLVGHQGKVEAVLFDATGQLIVTGGEDRIIRIWDRSTGELRRSLEGHTGRIHALALSPDGQVFASASSDQTIRLWRFPSGDPLFVLTGHTERVTHLVFHPFEERIFSASNHPDDGTLRVWDTKLGQQILDLPPPVQSIHGMAFDPTGKRLAVTAGSKLVLWEGIDRDRTSPELPGQAVKRPEPRPVVSDLADVPVKVLGWQRAKELPRMEMKVKDAITSLTPNGPEKEFLLVIISVPYRLLRPSPEQHAHLRNQAQLDADEPSAGPVDAYALYDPGQFELVLADGKNVRAFAAGPLPWARDVKTGGGFIKGITVETCTALFDPGARSLVAIAWEVAPPDLVGSLRLRLANGQLLDVPNVELKNYQGNRSWGTQRGSPLRGSPLLDVVRRYFYYETR